MNEVIKLLKNHRSVREFDMEKEITDTQVREIIETAMAAPNWINGQQVSIIEVREPAKKTKLAEAAGNQVWIKEAPVFLVFCLDFHRAMIAAEKNGAEFRVAKDIEAVIVGSTDVGILLSNAVAAAESMDLAIVPIGGVRRSPQTFIDLLQLPSYVFPIVGLAIGYPKNIPDQKPRLPLKAVYHKEQYNQEVQIEAINEYDETISTYMEERSNGQDAVNWSSKVSSFYETGFKAYAKVVAPALKKQGFTYN